MPTRRGSRAVALISVVACMVLGRGVVSAQSMPLPPPMPLAPQMPLPPASPPPGAAYPPPMPPVEPLQAPTMVLAQQPPTTSDANIAPPYRDTTPPPVGDGSGEKRISSGWDNGFYIRSSNDDFSLRITGQLQADYRWYTASGDTTDIDQFLLRRARFGLEATLFKYYDFRFLPDFGQGQTVLQDGYMNVHYWDAFQATAGKFKQPFSYEQLIQDRYTPFMERSLIDQLTPQRDLGLMAHGQNLFSGRLDYGVAVSNGEVNGNGDTNNSKDVNGRVAVRPFATWGGSFLQRFQVGISGGYGIENEPVNPNNLHTPAGVTFFKFNSNVQADGPRSRLSPEIAYFVGGFGMSAQYFHMDQKLRPGTAATEHVWSSGFYVQTSYLLTGEERTGYSQQIFPLSPFDPKNGLRGLGAWEILARVSRIALADIVFAPGTQQLADPALYSDAATEFTLGINWYLNAWVRVQFNWEHARFDHGVRLGPGPSGRLWGQDTLMTRLQFVF
jgi:phosphate-selective porin OprO/OprP